MITAILDAPPAVRPAYARPAGNDGRLLQFCALDCLPEHRRRLVCHWQHGADGRLLSVWELEILLAPHP